MIRPPKSKLTQREGVTAYTQLGGYSWFFLEKGDLAKKDGKRRAAWAQDGDRHYFACPFCKAINEAHTDGDGVSPGYRPGENIELSFIYNGRDLDSFSCEVCRKCSQHFWVTFVGAVPRKIWGALKLDKAKCPQCRKSVKGSSYVDVSFGGDRTTTSTMYVCCGMRWR